jgi:surface carbohydrate biosynthesis protein
VTTPATPRRVLIIVPYKARDLDGLALVAYHLERRFGHEVILTNGYRLESKLLQFAPDAVVFDHLLWGFKASQARLAKRLGMKVIVLPTEGLHQNDEEATQRAGKLQGVSQVVDCHFTWGDAVRDLMLRENLSSPDRVHTVGCPRFDFYRRPYLRLMGTREEFLRSLGVESSEGPVIVWATNTTYVSRNQRKILHRQVRQGKLSAGEVRSLLHDDQVQFREHSEAVLGLARRHPDWRILIKIHPAEWVNPYVELKAQAPNITLGFDQPIFKFLYHSDVLLQRGCTTATESWMLGKPVLELELGRFENAKREDFLAGNDIVRTAEELEAKILQYLAGAPIAASQQRKRDAFLAAYYGSLDGRAGERSAALIDRMLRPPAYTTEDQIRTANAVRSAREEKETGEERNWVNKAKDVLGIDRDVSLRFWRKLIWREQQDNLGLFVPEIDITREMVDRLHREYARILGDAAA